MTEVYNVTADFGGVVPNISQLHQEIVNSAIVTNFQGITYEEESETISIIFDASISGGEKTILDGLVAAHVPVFTPSTNQTVTCYTETKDVRNKNYERVGKLNFPGASYARAESVSHMDSGVTSYDIKITDRKNKAILLETTLTNTEEDIQDLGVLSNLSPNQALLEVHVRAVDASKKTLAHINSVKIYFN